MQILVQNSIASTHVPTHLNHCLAAGACLLYSYIAWFINNMSYLDCLTKEEGSRHQKGTSLDPHCSVYTCMCHEFS